MGWIVTFSPVGIPLAHLGWRCSRRNGGLPVAEHAVAGQPDVGAAERVLGLVCVSPDLIRIADGHGVVVYASDASVELLGCEPREVVGRALAEFNLPGDDAVMAQAQAEAAVTGVPVRRVHRTRCSDGGYRWMETSVRVTQTVRGRFSVLVSRSLVTSATRYAERTEARARARYLTDRERQVLLGLAEGDNVGSLARRLHIRECTVRGHIKCLLHKLQVHSQLQAVLVGMRAGVVPLDGHVQGL